MSSIRGVNVGGNLFDVTDSSNVAPIQLTNFATRTYVKDRCFIMADGLLYRATAQIESGDPIVINGNCRRTTLDEIISVIETDSDLIAPTEDGATSSDDYVIGDEIVRSGILYKVIDAISQGDAFAIGSNIDIAGSLTSQIKTLVNNDDAMLNVLGAKNLLPITGTSQTINGITFTVNSDGSVTVNGTASDSAYFVYYTTNVASQYPFKEGEAYIVSGHPNGLSDASRIQIEMNGSTIGTSKLNDGLFTAPAFNNRLNVYIRIQSGETINETFYPMIRPASVADDTYVPYAMTNRELTEHRLIYDEQQVTISGVPSKDWKNGTINHSTPSGYKVGSVTLKTSTGACIACISAITSTYIVIYARNMGNASTDVTIGAIILYVKD